MTQEQDALITYLLSRYNTLRRRLRVLRMSGREIQRDIDNLEKNKESYRRSAYIRLKEIYTEQLETARYEQRKIQQQIEQCSARIRQACGLSNA